MTWNISDHIVHAEKLLQPGIIGMYHSFDVIEIGGFNEAGDLINLLNLLIAEHRESTGGETPRATLLNPERIEIPGLRWKFGIARYRISTTHLIGALQHFESEGTWKPGRQGLKFGKLAPVPPQFIPSDTYRPHPWNRILKNNFWLGSHVLELFDTSKEHVNLFFESPKLLPILAQRIQEFIPIGIDGLSDRLGNVIIQFPVTVAVEAFGRPTDREFSLDVLWHPNTAPRPLQISWERFNDGTVEDFASAIVDHGPSLFPLHSQRVDARYMIWDIQNSLIIGASGPTAFLSGAISFSSSMVLPSTSREFLVPSDQGELELKSTQIHNFEAPRPSSPSTNPREPWTSRRIYRDSLAALEERRELKQYGLPNHAGPEAAFGDIHWLLETHGKHGAWLWDPYLDARDVLRTLFFCKHREVDLRALSSGKRRPDNDQTNPSKLQASVIDAGWNFWGSLFLKMLGLGAVDDAPAPTSWRDKQAAIMNQAKGNCEGLKLEFRTRYEGAGWPFHDRFLIFPGGQGGPVAWSLGASVNRLGHQHHIIQKVTDAALILQAFQSLWDKLEEPENIVWKTP